MPSPDPGWDGLKLRRARLEAGADSLAGAAGRVGMEPAHLSRLERGGRARPAWATVHRLIVGLGLGLEWFYPPDLILGAADRLRAGAAPRRKKGGRAT